MIDNLELKLKGKLPVTREELLELVSSWGRKKSFITSDRLEVSRCESKECYPLENLDVSQINKLSYMFRYSYYNGDLSKWNTSNCVDLFYAFAYSEFNNDSLNDWDVSNVKCLNKTFYESKFNGNLNNWNVISCFNIAGMFENSEFNNDSLKNWDVSNIDFMIDMFYGSKFNGDISNWNISNCEYLKRMFANSDFDGDISKWQFNKNVNCDDIFSENKNFEKKYNNEKELLEFTNEFLEWFEKNRINISNANISKEEKLDMENYLDNFNISKNNLVR